MYCALFEIGLTVNLTNFLVNISNKKFFLFKISNNSTQTGIANCSYTIINTRRGHLKLWINNNTPKFIILKHTKRS